MTWFHDHVQDFKNLLKTSKNYKILQKFTVLWFVITRLFVVSESQTLPSLLKNMRKSMIFAVYDDKFYIEHDLNSMLNLEIVILT